MQDKMETIILSLAKMFRVRWERKWKLLYKDGEEVLFTVSCSVLVGNGGMQKKTETISFFGVEG